MDDIEVIKKFALAERKFTLIIFISFLLFLSTFIAEQLGFGYLSLAYLEYINALNVVQCQKLLERMVFRYPRKLVVTADLN